MRSPEGTLPPTYAEVEPGDLFPVVFDCDLVIEQLFARLHELQLQYPDVAHMPRLARIEQEALYRRVDERAAWLRIRIGYGPEGLQ